RYFFLVASCAAASVLYGRVGCGEVLASVTVNGTK
ncbi:MAG: hypothetical protein RL369_2070, partial [Pseudomonadota bacterium]